MIIDKIREDMKAAMKAGEKDRLGVVRMLLSELKNEQINSREELTDAVEQRILMSYAKKRKEAFEAAKEAGRDEHASKEEFEYKLTMSYLPEQMGEDEVRAIVEKHAGGAEGNQAFGLVMKSVMAEVGSQADGKMVSAIVREVLGS